ncbi:MAG: methyltransferase domain-containing protein [Alphaproteobacteria bacterium]|nr:MAG: methyltransferase domain-containing protein [Alphaproteobacteria bacterium]
MTDWDAAGVPLPAGSARALYDAIVLLHHLERAPDPVAEMRAARRLLKPGGLLHLDVGEDGGWVIPLNALRRMIENTGFLVQKRVDRSSLRFRCRPS